jgi:hypothetical protein
MGSEKHFLTIDDLPTAKESLQASRVSEKAFESYLHNIILGIKNESKKGNLEFELGNIPECFCDRLKEVFEKKEYNILFKKQHSKPYNNDDFKITVSWMV